MTAKINLFFISIILFIPFCLFSQIKSNNDIIEKELPKKVVKYKTETNFIKSQSFYLKKDWDSTLIYSMKQLSSNTNKEIADYCHFFRGTSFFYKKM